MGETRRVIRTRFRLGVVGFSTSMTAYEGIGGVLRLKNKVLIEQQRCKA